MSIAGLDARGMTPELKSKIEDLLLLNFFFLFCFAFFSSLSLFCSIFVGVFFLVFNLI
jgi:hypothetical protein